MTTPGEVLASFTPWILSTPGVGIIVGAVVLGWWLEKEIDERDK